VKSYMRCSLGWKHFQCFQLRVIVPADEYGEVILRNILENYENVSLFLVNHNIRVEYVCRVWMDSDHFNAYK